MKTGGALWLAALLAVHPLATATAEVKIGSKKFTESVILAEMAAHLVRSVGGNPMSKRELGGTRILYNALVRGDLDIYPEYSGTISQEILAGRNVHDDDEIRQILAGDGIHTSLPLGFNNTYAIANLIRVRKPEQIVSHLQTRTRDVPQERMTTMERSLAALVRQGHITPLEAEQWSEDRASLLDELSRIQQK